MKLHFEANLDYQLQAIEAVCDLFRGQEVCRTEFTVTMPPDPSSLFGIGESDLGIGNRLQLLDDQVVENLREVQLRHGLEPSESLSSMDFTVEMETGTGKTYVYLRTIYKLQKEYGFTKFVIIVPSVAIKEGVYKSLQIMKDHFAGLYANVPCEFFLYDSGKLGQVRNFATSPHIQIMVVTVGAINKKDVNNLYKDSEKIGGEKPIDLIRATRPVLIVDEPQSVDGGLEGRGKEALAGMNPLCTLRYSATHVEKHHMVFRLDAVDAYERKLVKQIEVAALEVQGGHNRAYVRLTSVSNKRGTITAKLELDVQQGTGVVRKEVSVRDGDDLQQTTGRVIYANCRVGEIRTGKGQELVELKEPGGEHWLKLGEAINDVDQDAIKRQMIRRTIKEHLDKEMRLRPQGIKVLSLFFIDVVENYRKYNEDGQARKGKYATIFEEDTGIRFGIVEPHQFANIPVADGIGASTPLGVEKSRQIWEHLKQTGYLDAKGKVQDTLRTVIKDGNVSLPAEFQAQAASIGELLKKLAGKLDIKNADERKVVKTRQAVLESAEFRALWDRIKHKTTYRVLFDNDKLVSDCARAIKEGQAISKTRVHFRKAEIDISKGGVAATEQEVSGPVTLDETGIELPDILTDLQDKTQLTRKSLATILRDSERLDDFARNPQQFIELVTEAINRTKRMALVDGIKYQRLGDDHYYAQELFQSQELTGYLKNMLDVNKSVHEQVVYDLGGERSFAEQLEKNTSVKVYAKLPGWFQVPTPLGTYNPDWAVLIQHDGAERLYFVVETKPSLFGIDLRAKEQAKIDCGKAHFAALANGANPAKFVVATKLDYVLANG